jgi:hypothetical protein
VDEVMNKVLITYFMETHASQSGTGVGATRVIFYDTIEHLYQYIDHEIYMNSLLKLPEGESVGFILHPATEDDVYEKPVMWALGEEEVDD